MESVTDDQMIRVLPRLIAFRHPKTSHTTRRFRGLLAFISDDTVCSHRHNHYCRCSRSSPFRNLLNFESNLLLKFLPGKWVK